MAVETPGVLQNHTTASEIVRRMLNSHMVRGSGIGLGVGGLVVPSDCKVSYSGTELKVTVGTGELWVAGTNTAAGSYYTRVTATETLTPAAASTQNRIDAVCMRVKDQQYAGAENVAVLEVVKGTESAGTNLTTLAGAPAAPENGYILAYVLIPGGATTITNSEIKNVASIQRLTPLVYPGTASTATEIKPGEHLVVTGTTTITLPEPKVGNTVSVFCSSGETTVKQHATDKISGGGIVSAAASFKLTPNSCAVLVADGTNWEIIAGEPKPEALYGAVSTFSVASGETSSNLEASASRRAMVNLTALSPVESEPEFEITVFAEGKELPKIKQRVKASSSYPLSFILNPGQKWHTKSSTLSGGSWSISYNYILL